MDNRNPNILSLIEVLPEKHHVSIQKEHRGFTSYKNHYIMNPTQVQPEEHHDTIEKECKGIALMEVFGLVYIGHAPVTAENQFGTIRMISTSGEQFLYEVPEEKIEDVDMTKPTIMYSDDIAVSVKAPTCSFTKLRMDFDLFSGDYKGDIKVNVDWESIKRCNGQVACMEKRIISRDYTGEIAVRMGFFANATVAKLNITLLSQAVTDVYGVVVASNSKLDYAPKFASVLFVRKEINCIQVGEKGEIPLSKSLVGVPLDSCLHVDISLYVNGVHRPVTVNFKADTGGEATSLDYGNPIIKVNVEWDAKEDCATAEYKTVFDRKQESEFESLYGPFEGIEETMNIEKQDDAMMTEEKQEANAMIIKEKQEANAMMIEEEPTIVLRSVIDKYRYSVAEEVALKIPVIRARLKIYNSKVKNKTKPVKRAKFDIQGGVTKGSLLIVCKYLYNLVYPTENDFDVGVEFVQLEPYSILNLIQAAFTLKLTNLMDLICNQLVHKVWGDVHSYSFGWKMIPRIHSGPYKILKRTYDMSPSGPLDSGDGCSPDEKAISRDRIIDNFVNESYFLDVHLSPMVTSHLLHVGHWVNRLESTFSEHYVEVWRLAELEKPTSASVTIAILRLEEIIVGDPRFSSCLREHVVLYLVKLLESGAYNLDIQCAVVSILSRANFHVCGDVMEEKVVPLLGKLVSEPTGRLFHAAVSALTRLAYMFPNLIKVIVDDNTLQAVCNAFCNPCRDIYCLSKFLVAVCRGYRLSCDGFPSDKVETVLTILEEYQFTVTDDEDIHVFACYTLLHLSYGRSVALETKTWNKLIKRLIYLIHIPDFQPIDSTCLEYGSKKVMIIGSALGVIGNFIKWGSVQQIESLITERDLYLLDSLRRVLSFKLWRFQVEGCRIISNLAARRPIMDEIVFSGVFGCLCELLEDETFEVKWEAAWAVINGIYGCSKHRKKELCFEMEQAN